MTTAAPFSSLPRKPVSFRIEERSQWKKIPSFFLTSKEASLLQERLLKRIYFPPVERSHSPFFPRGRRLQRKIFPPSSPSELLRFFFSCGRDESSMERIFLLPSSTVWLEDFL